MKYCLFCLTFILSIHSRAANHQAPVQPGAPQNMYVNGSNINVRSGPGSNFEAVAQVTLGNVVSVIAFETDANGKTWAKVGPNHWISAGLLTTDVSVVQNKIDEAKRLAEEAARRPSFLTGNPNDLCTQTLDPRKLQTQKQKDLVNAMAQVFGAANPTDLIGSSWGGDGSVFSLHGSNALIVRLDSIPRATVTRIATERKSENLFGGFISQKDAEQMVRDAVFGMQFTGSFCLEGYGTADPRLVARLDGMTLGRDGQAQSANLVIRPLSENEIRVSGNLGGERLNETTFTAR